jgi:alkanesulfonate monooxygenase SsuD/methylene tetrahydromethanopterin reductase-like flavin-dependent oxidoreductase (luciferase family)
MIETGEGVSWADWVALAERAEAVGFDGLYVSDHYLSMVDEDRAALDAWGVLCGLSALTSRLRLGTLVSPGTFRHPAVLARLAATANEISGGRVSVGVGAGWFVREHEAFGFPFPDLDDRLSLLEEQASIVRALLDGEIVDHEGASYRLNGGRARGLTQGRIPLALGGEARPRMARLAARVADEYNVVWVEPETCVGARARLDKACTDVGRDPATLAMTLMTRCVIARDEPELRARLARMKVRDGRDAEGEGIGAWLIGTPEQVLSRIAEYQAAGVTGFRFQHLDHQDLEMIDLLGAEVLPHL